MRMPSSFRPLVALIPGLLFACQSLTLTPATVDPDDQASGGSLTATDFTSAAFSLPAATLGADSLARHAEGDAAFEAKFVTAPAPVHPGLGPTYNHVSCLGCHKGDGGGRPPKEGDTLATLLVRLSLPGQDPETGGPLPVPGFGTQLQDQAVYGQPAEAKFRITYAAVTGQFGDGEPYSLQQPTVTLYDSHKPLPEGVLLSARVTPPVVGMGLLEAIPESTIRAAADPDDRDGDGISGRVNEVWDEAKHGLALGRFGWKANTPTLRQQVAGAYVNDMGITSPLFPSEGPDVPAHPPEIDDRTLDANTHYLRTLAVPGRRSVPSGEVRRGAFLFNQARCVSCHAAVQRTGAFPEAPEVGRETIHPYTDLLLHDMGSGLADGRPDFQATGQEWRTTPLWGLGLRARVQGYLALLHDGRARTIPEAILWHGGEAEAAKEAFRKMPKADRAALEAFLNSL